MHVLNRRGRHRNFLASANIFRHLGKNQTTISFFDFVFRIFNNIEFAELNFAGFLLRVVKDNERCFGGRVLKLVGWNADHFADIEIFDQALTKGLVFLIKHYALFQDTSTRSTQCQHRHE